MIDFKYWIYSKDIAEWVAGRESLSSAEQIDCICMAPHRTLAEKLEGLRELNLYRNKREISDKVQQIEALSKHIFSDNTTLRYLYGVEIFYQGNRELVQPEMLFITVPQATAQIRKYIQKSVQEDRLDREHFYGVVHILEKMASDGYANVGDLIVNWKGEGIFYQSDYRHKADGMSADVGVGDYLSLRIPYPSGTIVSIEENCFLTPLKGILVNDAEPDETGFNDDVFGQWLIYPETCYSDQSSGIGIVNVRDDYVPFTDNQNLMLPYKQFIRRYDGVPAEREIWLQELSELIKADKSCFATILHDRQPKRGITLNQGRLTYVRSLIKRGNFVHYKCTIQDEVFC